MRPGRRWTTAVLTAVALLASGCGGGGGPSGGAGTPGRDVSDELSAGPSDSEESVPRQRPKGAESELAPALRGTVRDSSGRPLEGICVDQWGEGEEEDVIDEAARTDARGRYSIPRSPRDRDNSYWIEAIRFRDCRPRPRLAFRWYDDVRDLAAAHRFAYGRPASDIDAILPSGGSLSGLVTNDATVPIEGVCVSLYDGTYEDHLDEEKIYVPYARTETDRDGRYRFAGLATKQYRVHFSGGGKYQDDCTGGRYRSEWFADRPGGTPNHGNRPSWPSSDPVGVKEGARTTGIDATLLPWVPL